ncbi:MAG: hypothetical protein IJK30_07580 [Ruminococcus sp.]|nr:hypothetical protein [Ruminococcus sp.]
MKEKISKLIDVKSIVTLTLTGVFGYLSVKGEVPKEFLTVYTVVIGFYFGTQSKKNSKEKEK